MASWLPPNLDHKAHEFARRKGLTVRPEIYGAGLHGTVYAVVSQDGDPPWALKIHERRESYLREVDVYERLAELGKTHIAGSNVPFLIDRDDELAAIAMTMVDKPYVLDFAEASLDAPRDFSAEQMEYAENEAREDHGENWPNVVRILTAFEVLGIHLYDIGPRNIAFDS